MSTFINPVGPQSSKVYWRRRLLVGLGVLAAIIIVVLIVLKPGADAAPGDKANGVTPAPSTSASNSAKPSTVKACSPANVRVEAVTDKGTYAPGEQPLISMSISNVGATSCTINAGSTQQVLQITSGSDVIWTSTDCQTAATDLQITLEPATPQATQPIPWDRTRSSTTTCASTTRPAVIAAGASYHLTVKLGAVEAEKTKQFILK